MTKRLLGVAVVASAAALVAALVVSPDDPPERKAPTLEQMATAVGSGPMRLIVRGHVPGRSGDIALVPRPHRFMGGAWNLTTLDTVTPDVSTSHPNPWDYLVRVPLVFYGPGIVPQGAEVARPVDLTAIAPTYAEILGVRDFSADGSALPELDGLRAPKVIATVAIDGGGWNVLQRHPGSWPSIRELIQRGTSYENATVGSAPTVTAPIHTNMGTGSYPARHGIATNPVLSGGDPGRIRVPTISDEWGMQSQNDAITAMVAYESIHLGMLGHGASIEGADRDAVALWSAENRWRTVEPFFRLPPYLARYDGATLADYEAELDVRDGLGDGTWFGLALENIRSSPYRTGTPAFAKMTGDATVDILTSEPFGDDEITDLLWVEFKSPDYTGHGWGMGHPTMADTLGEVDAQIGRLKDALDDLVGSGEYILAITADHGMQPPPNEVGGWRVNTEELTIDLVAEFGDVVEKVTPTDVRLRPAALAAEDVDPEAVARFIGTYTISDNIPEDESARARVGAARLDERLFAGAFTSAFLQDLSSEEIAAFGEGTYPEADYVVGDE